MRKVLVIGATSAIARATLRLCAARGDRLYLLSRDAEALEAMASDLRIRGAESVRFAAVDANDFDGHRAALDAAQAALEGIDIVLIAHGQLPDQRACEQSFELTLDALNVNAISTLSWLTHLGDRLEAQGRGVIAVIGSVAGDRGRQSNYVYGAAKAAVHVFLQGLRNRLYAHGVTVLTIKPGLVDTPMTAAFRKGPLWARPEAVARDVMRAIDRRKDVLYTPLRWALIMAIIKAIPERVFKRLRL